MVRILGLSSVTAVACMLVAGCAGQNASSPSAIIPPAGSAASARSAGKSSSGPTVYVANRNSAGKSIVSVFSDGGATFLRKIEHGANVAADSRGYVYVAHSPVTVYSNAGKTLIQKFAVKAGPEFGIIVADGLGDFYVVAGGQSKRKLVEYEIGKTGSIRALNAIGLYAVTTDASGNVYLAFSDSLLVYVPGSSTPSRTITTGISGAESLAVDPAGNLYVGNANVSTNHVGTISVYAPGATSPSRTISNGVTSPYVLRTDSNGDLAVINAYNGFISTKENVTIYASGSSKPEAVITSSIDAANDLAFDSSNNLYIANLGDTNSDSGNVTVYAAGSYSLTDTITKNISKPASIAVGS